MRKATKDGNGTSSASTKSPVATTVVKAKVGAVATESATLYSLKDRAMQETANTAVAGSTIVKLAMDAFLGCWDEEWNPGQRGPKDHFQLLSSIEEVGLNTLPVVSKDAKGQLKGLRGHLRSQCIRKILADNPNVAKTHWPSGVFVQLVEGLDDEQQLYIARDHGQVVKRSRDAIIREGIDRMKNGQKPKAVMMSLLGELSEVWPPVTGKAKKRIAEAKTEAEFVEAMYATRRNGFQVMQALALNLPTEVADAYICDLNGDDSGERILQSQILKLQAANSDAIKQSEPSDNYKALYKQYVEENAGTRPKDKDKPMNKIPAYELSKLMDSSALRIAFHIFGQSKVCVDLAGLDKALQGVTIPEDCEQQLVVWDKSLKAKMAEVKPSSEKEA